SAASFFSGWRSTPGTIPATSQLSLLSSTTVINVRLASNGVRERLRSLSGFCFFGLRIEWLHWRVFIPAHGAIALLIIFRWERGHRRSPPSIFFFVPAGHPPPSPARSLHPPGGEGRRPDRPNDP